MPKAYSIELRERVVAHVEKGHTHRSTALHFDVSISFVNNMVKLKRESGDIAPSPHAPNKGKGKLSSHKQTIMKIIADKSDITLNELSQKLHQEAKINVSAWGLSKFLNRSGYTDKNTPEKEMRKKF